MDKDLVSEPLRSNRQLLEREALSVTIFERQAAVAAAGAVTANRGPNGGANGGADGGDCGAAAANASPL